MDLNIKNPGSSTGQMMSGSQAAKVMQNADLGRNVEDLRQASPAGAGTVSVGSAARQDSTSGRKSESETATPPAARRDSGVAGSDGDTLQSAVIHLRKCIATQDGGYKLLVQKASALEAWSIKTRSPDVKTAIDDLLNVIAGLKGSRENVIKAFNTLTQRVPKSEQTPKAGKMDTAAQTERISKDVGSQTSGSTDVQSSAILSAIAEVKVIIARTDARVTEQQEQIDKLQSRQEIASSRSAARKGSGNARVTEKQSITTSNKKKPVNKNDKSQSGTNRLGPPKVVDTECTDALGYVATASQCTQDTEFPPTDPEDGFTLVSRKTRRPKPEVSDLPNARKRIRVPKNQAVIIEKPTGSTSYADMIRSVKAVVVEENISSSDITTRRAKSGNVILEIPGKDQADNLATALRTRLGGNIGIRRPAPSVALLIVGIEDSVEDPELRAALASFDPELQGMNSVNIRQGKSGIRSAVVRVPIRAGLKLAEARKIKIGWAVCRIRQLDDRALACNKCKEKGHSASACTGAEKRRCFRCKESGHLVAVCPSPADESTSATDTNSKSESITPSGTNARGCEVRPDQLS